MPVLRINGNPKLISSSDVCQIVRIDDFSLWKLRLFRWRIKMEQFANVLPFTPHILHSDSCRFCNVSQVFFDLYIEKCRGKRNNDAGRNCLVQACSRILLFTLTKSPTEFLLNDMRVQNHSDTNDTLEKGRKRWNAGSNAEQVR